MKNKSNGVARIAALAAGLGLAAMVANAQQGTFNLPVQAHWGNVVLQPGEHNVQIPLPIGQTFVYIRSRRATKVTIPLSIERTATSDRSYLRLAKVDGEYYVSEFQCGPDGKRFIFPKPKTAHRVNAGAEEADAGLITVAAK